MFKGGATCSTLALFHAFSSTSYFVQESVCAISRLQMPLQVVPRLQDPANLKHCEKKLHGDNFWIFMQTGCCCHCNFWWTTAGVNMNILQPCLGDKFFYLFFSESSCWIKPECAFQVFWSKLWCSLTWFLPFCCAGIYISAYLTDAPSSAWRVFCDEKLEENTVFARFMCWTMNL